MNLLTMRKFVTIGIAVVLAGCAATPSVQEANDADSINTVSMSCNSPYPLEQDCSIWSGATRKISVEGFEVKVAASADGKVILVMDSKLFSNLMSDPFTLNKPTHSKASNDSFYAVKKILDIAGIKINRVRPLRSFGNVDGYILELDSDGYTLLKKPSYAAIDEHAIAIKKTTPLIVAHKWQPCAGCEQVMPARAFDIEGGSVQMQGGIQGSKQPGIFGGKNEVVLFLILKNEGKTSIWAEVEFQLPGTQQASAAMKMIESGGQVIYKHTISEVAWNVEYPFKVSVFSDQERKKMFGTEVTYFFFEEKEKKYWEELIAKLKPNQEAVVSGFRELGADSLESEVTGTRTDPVLRRDITWNIFKSESKSHKDCEHRILKAEPYGTAKGVIEEKMGPKAQALGEKIRSAGDMFIEKWWVQSCETTSTYEVMLLRSPQGGTDIIVEKLGEEPAQK